MKFIKSFIPRHATLAPFLDLNRCSVLVNRLCICVCVVARNLEQSLYDCATFSAGGMDEVTSNGILNL